MKVQINRPSRCWKHPGGPDHNPTFAGGAAMADQHLITSEEIWKPIPGFPGYEVSDHGRVRSFWTQRGRQGFDWFITTVPERILKPSGKRGYLIVWLRKDGKTHARTIHRVVLETFIGPCPNGMEACHDDGFSRNCRLDNLRWDTPKNNHADKRKHCTSPHGERQGAHKLTTPQVLQIREMALSGSLHKEIAKIFGISRAYVSEIVTRKKWKHI